MSGSVIKHDNHSLVSKHLEADDRQVTTVFTVQPSFIIRTRQTEYHEALPSSVNVQSHLTSSFADDGNAS